MLLLPELIAGDAHHLYLELDFNGGLDLFTNRPAIILLCSFDERAAVHLQVLLSSYSRESIISLKRPWLSFNVHTRPFIKYRVRKGVNEAYEHLHKR